MLNIEKRGREYFITSGDELLITTDTSDVIRFVGAVLALEFGGSLIFSGNQLTLNVGK